MNNTYLEINLDTLKNNVNAIIKKYNNYKYYLGVVKSDAYGHGSYIVNSLIEGGINYLAVSYLDEAIEVRKYNKDVPLLCFVPIDLNDLEKAIENNITITITSYNYLLDLIKKLKQNIKVHIKLDCGMNRLGFKNKDEITKAFNEIKNNKYITLEGIYTHLSSAGIHESGYDDQVKKFRELTGNIELNKIPIVHITSSSNLVAHEKIEWTNGVRLGSIMYGYNPTIRTNNHGILNRLRNIRNKYMQKKLNLSKVITDVELDIKPAIKMYCGILQIKDVNKDEHIGYGLSYKANENMKIAIIPVGYNNGIGFSINSHYVMINNKKYYSVGQTSMNMMAIKIDETVNIDDKVYIINESITPKMVANMTNKLTIEILLMAGHSNNKIYIKDEKQVN